MQPFSRARVKIWFKALLRSRIFTRHKMWIVHKAQRRCYYNSRKRWLSIIQTPIIRLLGLITWEINRPHRINKAVHILIQPRILQIRVQQPPPVLTYLKVVSTDFVLAQEWRINHKCKLHHLPIRKDILNLHSNSRQGLQFNNKHLKNNNNRTLECLVIQELINNVKSQVIHNHHLRIIRRLKTKHLPVKRECRMVYLNRSLRISWWLIEGL